MLYVLMVLCLSRWALAQLSLDGPCPKVDMMQDFNFTKFVGVWYVFRQTDQPVYRGVQKCIKTNYTIEDNGYARLTWSCIYRPTGQLISYPGRVYPMDPAEPATIKIQYMDGSTRFWQVFSTDYESFSVLYSCKNGPWSHMVWVALEMREQNPTDTVLETAWKFIDKLGIPRLMLSKVKQTDCELKPDKPMTE